MGVVDSRVWRPSPPPSELEGGGLGVRSTICFVIGQSFGVSRYAVGAPRTRPAFTLIQRLPALTPFAFTDCLLPVLCARAGTRRSSATVGGATGKPMAQPGGGGSGGGGGRRLVQRNGCSAAGVKQQPCSPPHPHAHPHAHIHAHTHAHTHAQPYAHPPSHPSPPLAHWLSLWALPLSLRCGDPSRICRCRWRAPVGLLGLL